jgi:imidazole glycerol-phosphate synthase subunit HisH
VNEICIIDYKTGGNIFSLQNSLKFLDIHSYLSSDPQEISSATKIIFPGVGSYAKAMAELKKLKLIEVIQDKANSNTPFMGVCVGMQVLFEYGTEGSKVKGLGIIPGSVDKFPETSNYKIPHMGWNTVNDCDSEIFADIKEAEYFYFVHSYRVSNDASEAILKCFPRAILSKTNYIENFVSAFYNGNNLYACQFHPEKSGEAGLQVLKNFAKLK